MAYLRLGVSSAFVGASLPAHRTVCRGAEGQSRGLKYLRARFDSRCARNRHTDSRALKRAFERQRRSEDAGIIDSLPPMKT